MGRKKKNAVIRTSPGKRFQQPGTPRPGAEYCVRPHDAPGGYKVFTIRSATSLPAAMNDPIGFDKIWKRYENGRPGTYGGKRLPRVGNAGSKRCGGEHMEDIAVYGHSGAGLGDDSEEGRV